MEKGINLQIQELKEKLVKDINDSKLPIAIVQMALFEISNQVNSTSAQQIEAERIAYAKSQKEVKKDAD